MARQERELTQHSDAEPRSLINWPGERLDEEEGREESTMSTKRERKAVSPTSGVVTLVAPLGVHSV